MSYYNNDPLWEAIVKLMGTKKETNMQQYDNDWINNESGKPEDQKHYQGLIQPIELMQELLSHKEFVGFCKGNMIKYAYRAGRKEGESGKKDKEKYEAYKEFLNRFLYGRPLIDREAAEEDEE